MHGDSPTAFEPMVTAQALYIVFAWQHLVFLEVNGLGAGGVQQWHCVIIGEGWKLMCPIDMVVGILCPNDFQSLPSFYIERNQQGTVVGVVAWHLF